MGAVRVGSGRENSCPLLQFEHGSPQAIILFFLVSLCLSVAARLCSRGHDLLSEIPKPRLGRYVTHVTFPVLRGVALQFGSQPDAAICHKDDTKRWKPDKESGHCERKSTATQWLKLAHISSCSRTKAEQSISQVEKWKSCMIST